MKKLFLICIASVVLVGCSTTPVSPLHAKDVKPVIKYQQYTGTVPTTIVRDNGWISGMCKITVYIDGEQVANLDTAEKTTVYIKPSQIVIGAGFIGSGMCHGVPRKERTFDINQKSQRVIRIFIDQAGNVDLLPMTIN